jgi:integrase
MPKNRPHPPKYRHYKPKDLAVVRIDGKDHYLGKYGSQESHDEYDRLVGEWLLTRRRPIPIQDAGNRPPAKVGELILAFWDDVKQRYVKHGKATSEQRSFRTALRPVLRLYGNAPVTAFGPLALIACRQCLIDAGVCRKRINQHIGRIRLMFKWGVARELVPETVWRALCAVEGLKKGEAHDRPPVKPVGLPQVEAIRPYVTPAVWAMIQLQLWTSCRPGEACLIRGIDLNTQGPIWEFRPHVHKTEHHGKERVIYLGPHAQEIIKPWLKTDLQAYLFSPREARAWFQAERAKRRKTPLPAATRKRLTKAAPKRAPGDGYDTRAFDHAVARACEKAFGMPEELRRIPKDLPEDEKRRLRELARQWRAMITGRDSASMSG